jgi:NitT/TauT family transport system substrate-binding protein
MLEDNDVPSSEVTFVEVPPDKVLGAIPGLVDAGYTYDPYTSEALARGNRVIYTTANATGLGVDVMAFRREIVRDRPEDVRAFVAAWLDAVDYWKHNPAEGNAIIAKVTGLKPEEVSPIGVDLFDRNANLMTFVPGSTYSSVYYTAGKLLEFLLNNGDVTYPVDLKEFLDPSFLK